MTKEFKRWSPAHYRKGCYYTWKPGPSDDATIWRTQDPKTVALWILRGQPVSRAKQSKKDFDNFFEGHEWAWEIIQQEEDTCNYG